MIVCLEYACLRTFFVAFLHFLGRNVSSSPLPCSAETMNKENGFRIQANFRNRPLEARGNQD